VNAGLSIALEADATHRGARLHPGGVTIAAALAQAEHLGSQAGQLLDAIVRGYEAMVRVGESTGAAHYVHWHTTSTCGPFGSAAAAVSLVLDARGTDVADGRAVLSSALGTASSATGGLWQTREEHTPTKMVHAGQAAVAGLQAAALTAAGLQGPLAILEGPHGLFAATCPDPEPDAVTAPCRAGWKIHETSLKPWCACRHVHPAVGAALELRAQLEARGATADDLATVDLRTYRDALEFADCPIPTSSRSAMFSLQHTVAVALVTGDLPLAALDEARLADPPVAALRARIQVGTDPGLERAYPDAWGCRLVAQLADGTGLVVERPHAKGDPDDPLDGQEVEAKARALMDWAGVPSDVAAGLVAAVGRLADGGPVADLTAALGAVAAAPTKTT
jgi:2-methylcitrate dehydratase PrpD